MFYAWLGASIWFHKENYRESYQYLQKSLSLGEETQNQKVIGYACAWLSWVCTEFNQMEEGIRYGERAQDISKDLPADKYLYFKSLAGMGYAYCCLGMWKQANEAGEAIVNYGEKDSNLRAMGIGHFVVGWSHLICGDLQSAIASCKKSIEVSADPFYSNAYNFTLGVCYAIDGKFQKAEQCLLEAKNFFQKVGLSWTETMCTMYLSVVLIAKGNMNQGFQLLLEAQRKVIECDRKYYYAMSEYLFGSLYLQIVQREGDTRLSDLIKNIGFLAKHVPGAAKKAERHFNKAIEAAREIGAKGIEGQTYLDLGKLHKAKGKSEQARDFLSRAIKIFEETEAEYYLKQANELSYPENN
jgi:tetratricopeptide (TPR) repeat protein